MVSRGGVARGCLTTSRNRHAGDGSFLGIPSHATFHPRSFHGRRRRRADAPGPVLATASRRARPPLLDRGLRHLCLHVRVQKAVRSRIVRRGSILTGHEGLARGRPGAGLHGLKDDRHPGDRGDADPPTDQGPPDAHRGRRGRVDPLRRAASAVRCRLSVRQRIAARDGVRTGARVPRRPAALRGVHRSPVLQLHPGRWTGEDRGSGIAPGGHPRALDARRGRGRVRPPAPDLRVDAGAGRPALRDRCASAYRSGTVGSSGQACVPEEARGGRGPDLPGVSADHGAPEPARRFRTRTLDGPGCHRERGRLHRFRILGGARGPGAPWHSWHALGTTGRRSMPVWRSPAWVSRPSQAVASLGDGAP